ncbi:sulfatase-like hydrolase/transferase [Gracilibacillus oryzae]|uniref:Sulfatase-like hydrolase/transferase n=1 Tax=Gracilibacillus oryzae TaxID=1672701 RepID=A0A7C8KUQ1_9BACI|nr:sulfatase-like hydrolase/transferase [Gracilibacillus oryzae]KAB8137654.1 sulfatase-like hydrolase/transferase [Gracilibacillus oryzae]
MAKTNFNIVWMVQDHVLWKHYKETIGPKPKLQTYKRLSSEGMEFNRAHTIIPLCTPARGSLLTGVYPHKHGLINNNKHIDLISEDSSEISVFSKYLLDAGYRTAYFGKWHAGAGTAEDCGFEGYSLPGYGNPYNTKEYEAYLEKHQLPKPFVDIEWRPSGELLKNIDLMERGLEPDPAIGIGHPSTGVIKAPAQTTESYFLSHMASDWLEERAKDKESFALRIDTWGPHQPYLVANEFRETIEPKQIPEYPNFSNDFSDRPAYHKRDRDEWRRKTGFTAWEEWQPIVARAYEHFSQTDAGLELVLDTLERTGLDKNTIVIYTADHGDILASNGGLFDKDSMLTEETMSIPLVINWPGVTNSGKLSDELVSNMDIVPTILELAGLQVPNYMDGKSLVDLVRRTKNDEWRADLMAEHFGHMNYEGIQRVLYWGNYKYVAHLHDSDELYDLNEDPFELINLIGDPSKKTILEKIKNRLFDRMAEYEDQLEDSKALIKEKQYKRPLN